MNAGPAVDAEVAHRPAEGTSGAAACARTGRPATAEAPDELDLLATGPEKMVGLPGQRPGYPGQQRSVDTG